MNVKFDKWIDKENKIARLEITSFKIPVNEEVLDMDYMDRINSVYGLAQYREILRTLLYIGMMM